MRQRHHVRRADRARGRSSPRRSATRIPSMEMVRAVSSGTEATMSALRLARGFTGRDKIIKIDGGYHGHADCLLVTAGSGAATLGIPGSAGVPEGAARDTLVVPYNDLDAVERDVRRHGDDRRASSSSRSPATWAASCPRPASSRACARITHEARRAADLRRGDDRLPRRATAARRRSTASRPTSRASARSSAAACPPRRSAAAPTS